MEEYGLWRCFAPHYIDGLKHNLFEPVLQCGNSKAFIKELFGWMTPCKALSHFSFPAWGGEGHDEARPLSISKECAQSGRQT